MRRKKEQASARFLKKSMSSKIFDFCNAVFMIAFCITIIFPIWDIVVKSLSSAGDISYMSLNLIPKKITFSAYEYCLKNEGAFHALFVSVARTIIGTLIHIVITSMAAYALSKPQLPCIKFIQIYFLVTMFVSAGTIPTYLNMKELGLTNSFLAYVLPSGFSMYNCIVLRNYFYSIDRGMEESASIDGASQIRIFLSIILPLSKPVLATVALWQMVGQWNAWFDNMLYNAQNEKLRTLQYLLRRMLDRMSSSGTRNADALLQVTDMTEDSVKAAVTVIVMIPIMCVYPFIQKYFVKGIMIGAVKG